jgi:hypothetical protein
MSSMSLATLATGICSIGGASSFIPGLQVHQKTQSHRDSASNEYHSHDTEHSRGSVLHLSNGQCWHGWLTAWEKRIAFVTLSLEISAVCFSRVKPLKYVVAKFLGAFDAFAGQPGLIW